MTRANVSQVSEMEKQERAPQFPLDAEGDLEAAGGLCCPCPSGNAAAAAIVSLCGTLWNAGAVRGCARFRRKGVTDCGEPAVLA